MHHLPADPLLQLANRERFGRLVQLHRRVVRLQEHAAPDVADQNEPTWRHCPRRAFEHFNEVVDAREVLDDRVEDHRVVCARLDVFESICRLMAQVDLR